MAITTTTTRVSIYTRTKMSIGIGTTMAQSTSWWFFGKSEEPCHHFGLGMDYGWSLRNQPIVKRNFKVLLAAPWYWHDQFAVARVLDTVRADFEFRRFGGRRMVLIRCQFNPDGDKARVMMSSASHAGLYSGVRVESSPSHRPNRANDQIPSPHSHENQYAFVVWKVARVVDFENTMESLSPAPQWSVSNRIKELYHCTRVRLSQIPTDHPLSTHCKSMFTPMESKCWQRDDEFLVHVAICRTWCHGQQFGKYGVLFTLHSYRVCENWIPLVSRTVFWTTRFLR